ncbi:MAG: hypothetical protein M9899_03270 [Bdellovibrionaceae bacterium]|nr:hypothetical protein [Pseudobdellovibrionaceae bacterium]
MKKIAIAFAVLLSTTLVYAQDEQPAARQKQAPRTTVLSFEDELIQGDVSSPDLFVILKNKNLNFGKLLRLRENFIPEMRQTRQDVHGSQD